MIKLECPDATSYILTQRIIHNMHTGCIKSTQLNTDILCIQNIGVW